MTTIKGSNLTAGNNVTITSGTKETTEDKEASDQDINIIGSNIIANNDVMLTAEKGEINVISQELLQNVLNEQKTQTITTTVGVQNSWLATADNGYNMSEDYDDNSKNNTSVVLNTLSDTLGVMTSWNTAGFGLSVDISYSNTETTTQQNSVYNQESSIISYEGDIGLTAENDVNITGSNVVAYGEDTEINLTSNNGNINIQASKDTYAMNSTSNATTYNVGINVGGNSVSGTSFSYGEMESDTNAKGISYNNSAISNTNGTINITTNNTNNDITENSDEVTGNITVSGANIVANDINISVANNLTIESLQDSYNNTTDIDGWEAGVTMMGSIPVPNVSATNGYDKTNTNWVNNQTSIIGMNSVTINTGTGTDEDGNNIAEGNTNIVGAIITSGYYDENDEDGDGNMEEFIDTGNLTLNTNTLTYSNVYDNDDNSHSQGTYGIGTNLIVQYTSGGYDKDQKTYATLGNGKITVGGVSPDDDESLVAGLNRDINSSQIITRDSVDDEYDIDVNVNLIEAYKMYEFGLGGYMKNQNNELKLNINRTEAVVNAVYDGVKETISKIADPEQKANLFSEVALQYQVNLLGLPEYVDSPTKQEKKEIEEVIATADEVNKENSDKGEKVKPIKDMTADEKLAEINKLRDYIDNGTNQLTDDQKTYLAGLYASLSLDEDYLSWRNELKDSLSDYIKNNKDMMNTLVSWNDDKTTEEIKKTVFEDVLAKEQELANVNEIDDDIIYSYMEPTSTGSITAGYFNQDNDTVTLNSYLLSNNYSYPILLNTTVHEGLHRIQYYYGNDVDKYSNDNKGMKWQLEIFKANFAKGMYFSTGLGDSFERYKTNPIEVDAKEFGKEISSVIQNNVLELQKNTNEKWK